MRQELSNHLLDILYLTPERHPTSRPDVAVLFGKYLPRHGYCVDLVALAAQSGDVAPWRGGKSLVSRATRSTALNVIKDLWRKVVALLLHGWGRYAAVVVRDMPTLGGLAWLAARLRGVAFIYWMSFPIVAGYQVLVDLGPRKIGWIRWMYAFVRAQCGRLILNQIVLRVADHVFVQSESMKTALVAQGCDARRLTAVPMGVDLEDEAFRDISPHSLPNVMERDVIVYVGSLGTSRRLDVMIEAFAIAWRKRPRLQLVVVGRGELPGQEDALREVAQRAGVSEQIVWKGWLPQAEALRQMREAIIGLSFIPRGAMYDVSSPTKVCEYLAMGVPALVNDLPDQVLLAQSSGAARVVEMEPHRMAEELLVLVSDPVTLRRMAELGPVYVARERSYAVLGPRVADTMREVIDAAQRHEPMTT